MKMAHALVLAVLLPVALGLSSPPHHNPKPAWRLGDSKEKFKDLKKSIAKSDFMNKPKTPAHIKEHARAAVEGVMGEIVMVERGGCGAKVSTKDMGIKPHLASFLQEDQHPGEDSFSKVGSGGVQKVKDEGSSTMGTIDLVDPYVSVLKDGFFEVGCFTDTMLEFGDKYGNGKFKYPGKSADYARTSIVLYNEIVLDEKKKPMTPIVCFEFCRTIMDMVFFGINNGDQCYCTPYYKPGPSDASQCDVPCAGDATNMCGNKVKSTMFEMHLCADTMGRLKETMTAAKESLDFYFETAVLANNIGSQMTRSGKALEKLAGLSGASEASTNGRAAQGKSKFLVQGYKPSFKTYNELLEAYKGAVDLKGADFGKAENTNMAELVMRTMKKTTGPVLAAASNMAASCKASYPLADAVFGDDPDPSDEVATALKAGTAADFDFRPASYMWDPNFKSPQSSCGGMPIGPPLVGLGIKECAKVCEATIYPDICVGISFYAIQESETMDGKGLSDLCFMFMDIKLLRTFSCPDGPDLVQTASNHTTLRGATQVQNQASASAVCLVKMSEIATGYKPKNGKWEKAERCFGKLDSKADVPDAYQSFKMPAIAKMELDGKDTIAPPP